MCDHVHFIEIIAKASDCFSVYLKEQKQPNEHPIEQRPFTFSSFGQPVHDTTLASSEGYCPNIDDFGGGDYVCTRICVQCKQVLNLPTCSIEEWKKIIEPEFHEENDDDDEEPESDQ